MKYLIYFKKSNLLEIDIKTSQEKKYGIQHDYALNWEETQRE